MFKFLWRWQAPKDISIDNILIPSPEHNSQIRLCVYRSKTVNEPAPAMVWLHGGGYIVGKPEQDDGQCNQYVHQAGVVIVSVDYRCAPEHPFPRALEDSYTALRWVKANAAQIGVNANRIAIGGESGGGGLAAALAQYACDRTEVEPIFQLLVYPMLDDRTSIRTDIVDDWHLMWNQASNKYGWESYLGQECGATDVPPYAVPARRNDLTGLPPAWIGVGTLDLFHDEDVAFARRLKECGVPCELNVVQGAFHGFDVPASHTQVARDFRNSQVAALKKYLF